MITIRYILSVSRFLITTGKSSISETKSDIIDLSVSDKYQCSDWVDLGASTLDLPMDNFGATGGLLGKTLVFCGGTNIDKCYKINSKNVEIFAQMSTTRLYASSVTINDSILWITGGLGIDFQIQTDFVSSEFVLMNGSVILGPNLPMQNTTEIELYSHAMVNINNVLTMVIGGRHAGKNKDRDSWVTSFWTSNLDDS